MVSKCLSLGYLRRLLRARGLGSFELARAARFLRGLVREPRIAIALLISLSSVIVFSVTVTKRFGVV